MPGFEGSDNKANSSVVRAAELAPFIMGNDAIQTVANIYSRLQNNANPTDNQLPTIALQDGNAQTSQAIFSTDYAQAYTDQRIQSATQGTNYRAGTGAGQIPISMEPVPVYDQSGAVIGTLVPESDGTASQPVQPVQPTVVQPSNDNTSGNTIVNPKYGSTIGNNCNGGSCNGGGMGGGGCGGGGGMGGMFGGILRRMLPLALMAGIFSGFGRMGYGGGMGGGLLGLGMLGMMGGMFNGGMGSPFGNFFGGRYY